MTLRRVVLAHAFVVALTLGRDPVFRARQLVHQAVELFVGFKVGIVLDDQEQPSKRARLLVRRGDGFVGRFRVEQPRPGVGDFLEDAFFMRRVALDRFNQVRDQVVPALQLILHLRPLRFDRFFLADELVVRTT